MSIGWWRQYLWSAPPTPLAEQAPFSASHGNGRARTSVADSEVAKRLVRQSEALCEITLMDALLRVLREVFLRASEHEDLVMGFWEDRIVRGTHQGEQ